ncbi:MAG: HPr family phosphocarrier protein [Pseudomonadota bacterium]
MDETFRPQEGAPHDAVVRRVTIQNQKGLHARASAKFVKCAAGFEAHIRVAREGTQVDGTSIMGLMMLGAHQGAEIEITAWGPQAEPALAALFALIEAKFDEDG